jgi:hypothetical protein
MLPFATAVLSPTWGFAAASGADGSMGGVMGGVSARCGESRHDARLRFATVSSRARTVGNGYLR